MVWLAFSVTGTWWPKYLFSHPFSSAIGGVEGTTVTLTEMWGTSLEAEFELAAGRNTSVIIDHLLQLLTAGSERPKLSVSLRRKGKKEQGIKIRESTISLQNFFGVADEGGRKDKVDPSTSTRHQALPEQLLAGSLPIIRTLNQILGYFQIPLNCHRCWCANNLASSHSYTTTNQSWLKLLLSSLVKGLRGGGGLSSGAPKGCLVEPGHSWGHHGGVEKAWTVEPDRSAASWLWVDPCKWLVLCTKGSVNDICWPY